MADLLQVLDIFPQGTPRKGIPLAMEFPVDAQSGPYLVSSSSDLIWVQKTSVNSTVRAAVRRDVVDNAEFFRDVIFSIAKMGVDSDWGNIHPLTKYGIQSAINHVKYYDIADVELLAPVDDKGPCAGLEDWNGVPITRVSWLSNCVVAAPTDKAFVGFLTRIDKKSIVSVIHNASRGIGIAMT